MKWKVYCNIQHIEKIVDTTKISKPRITIKYECQADTIFDAMRSFANDEKKLQRDNEKLGWITIPTKDGYIIENGTLQTRYYDFSFIAE